MSSLDEVLEAAVDAAVRRHAAEVQQRPIFVNQRTVETVVGLPPRDYLRLVREGAWPSARERRLIVSKTSDVTEYMASRLTIRTAEEPKAEPLSAEARALARVGGRRVA